MKKSFVLVALCMVLVPVGNLSAAAWRKANTELLELNRKLKGKVLDFTANHGTDNRIWSRALGQRRDLYVYVPPNFDPRERYPLVLFLHGLNQDEQVLLSLAPLVDHAIYVGDLPPLIVAAPDGSVRGEPCIGPGTFFINSNLGDFEDYLLNDVWDYLATRFPIRSEREAHILAGVSMGGMAAFNIGIRNRNAFGTAIGIHPPLNMRWMNDCGNYMAKFDPYHWGWRNTFDHPGEVIGRFGLAPVRVSQLIKPMFGSPDEALVEVSRNNPIELIDKTGLRNGDLQMYVGYGGQDEFNIDAQVESFLYYCKYRQINVAVGYDPNGRHDLRTAYRLWPGICTWLKPRITSVELPIHRVPPHANELIVARKQMTPIVSMPAPMAESSRPQPLNRYWTPPHIDVKSIQSPKQNAPTDLPSVQENVDTRSSPLTGPPPARDPVQSARPPGSRQDLGPTAPPAIRYGIYDGPPSSPTSPTSPTPATPADSGQK